jgi:hypothetical protein
VTRSGGLWPLTKLTAALALFGRTVTCVRGPVALTGAMVRFVGEQIPLCWVRVVVIGHGGLNSSQRLDGGSRPFPAIA